MPTEGAVRSRQLEEGEVVDDEDASIQESRRKTSQNEPPPKKTKVEKEASIATKTGGAYIPPAKLRLMQQQITDKSRYWS